MLALWGLFLGVFAAVLWVWGPYALPPLILTCAAAAALLAGLVLIAWPEREPRVRAVPEISLPSALAAVGATTALYGVSFGLWLVLIGAGLGALGIAGVVRELRGELRDRGAR
ncbi:MAG: hypothetical protein QOK40_3415 [Miltoncostaeaceae bacterium]|nr:hypothetical protein [Miltoncostaeaceae bacterium]